MQESVAGEIALRLDRQVVVADRDGEIDGRQRDDVPRARAELVAGEPAEEREPGPRHDIRRETLEEPQDIGDVGVAAGRGAGKDCVRHVGRPWARMASSNLSRAHGTDP